MWQGHPCPGSCFNPHLLLLQEGQNLKRLPDVQFIDFEYSSHSYTTFDIANHFCEYAGFECDYTRFPGDDHMLNFMSHYLYGGTTDSAVSRS